MARRDASFSNATNLAVVGPLTAEALERLPGRFREWAASPGGARYAFRRSGTAWVPVRARERAGRVESAVVRTGEVLDVAGIEALARRLEYADFGAILILTPTFAAVSFSHYFGDGPAALGPLRAVLSGVPSPEPRMARFPLLRALLTTGQWRPSALRAGRELQRSMHRHFAVASLSEPGQATTAETLSLSAFTVDARRLRAVAARERQAAVSVSTLDVLTSLVFRSFAACLAEGADMPVRMLVGLRQHLPHGLSAPGNFSSSVILGSLRGQDWSPTEVGRAMGPVTGSATVVASEAVEVLAHARARLRRRASGAEAGTPLMLTYNVLTGRIGVDKADFLPGEQPQSTLLMLNRGPLLGPHCTVTATGGDFLVTTVDDTGLLDLDRFETAMRAELG